MVLSVEEVAKLLASVPGPGLKYGAALGISEETDAVALVVSEESGEISIAVGGRLEQNLEPRALRARLVQRLVQEVEAARAEPPLEEGA